MGAILMVSTCRGAWGLYGVGPAGWAFRLPFRLLALAGALAGGVGLQAGWSTAYHFDQPAYSGLEGAVLRGQVGRARVLDQAPGLGDFDLSQPATVHVLLRPGATGSLSLGADVEARWQDGLEVVTIPAHSDFASFTIAFTQNGTPQPNRAATLKLGNGMVAPALRQSASLLLVDEDTPVVLEASGPAEEAGPRAALVTVSRPGVTAGELTVHYGVGGTALPGVDYVPLPGSVTIPSGRESATFAVVPIDDRIPEPLETVLITLAPCAPNAGAGYTAGSPAEVSLALLDNDPVVNLVLSDPTASREGDGALITLTRTAGMDAELRVNLRWGGDAVNGRDYAFLPAWALIPPGSHYTTLTLLPLLDPFVTGSRTATLTLAGGDYTIGSTPSVSIPIPEAGAADRTVPTGRYVLAAEARGGRFTRGAGADPLLTSFVIPLEFQRGVPLDPVGGNADALFPGHDWTTDFFHYDATRPAGLTPPAQRLRVRNPLVAFGGRVGGSPLYCGQAYSFLAYAGECVDPALDLIQIRALDPTHRTVLSTQLIRVPRPADAGAWSAFQSAGYTQRSQAGGLTTVLAFDHGSLAALSAGGPGAFHLTHSAGADAAGLLFEISVTGRVGASWMVIGGTGAPAPSRLYTLEFEERPGWRLAFLDQPHFTGVPGPSFYDGTAIPVSATNLPPLTNAFLPLPDPAGLQRLDHSPELRRHPLLDRLAADLRHDPLALVNYVLNEIETTDALDYGEDPAGDSPSINLGGVARGALGVFLEGQGSPLEQCALLVYLLRQAGVPATYVFAQPDRLLLHDQRLSRLLGMQLRGALDARGRVYTTNPFIPANYPWVAARVGSRWVHVFPWLKDVEVSEGLDLDDVLPASHPTLRAWWQDYLRGDTNLLNLDPRNSPADLFPLWLEKHLRESAPGLALEDLGVRRQVRRHQFSRWEDLPRPDLVTGSLIPVESLGSPSLTLVSPRLTNLFDTVHVEVASVARPSVRVVSGELRVAELHHRRFLVRHEKVSATSHKLILSLAAFAPATPGQGAFSSVKPLDPVDPAVLKSLVQSVLLNASDDELALTMTWRRHRDLPHHAWWTNHFPAGAYLGLGSELVSSQTRPLRKGDLAALCLNAGRVTRRLLELHAQEFWRLEQAVAADPAAAATFPPDLLQGGPAHLLGLSYYQRVGESAQAMADLTKTWLGRQVAMGLAKFSPQRTPEGALPNGDIVPVFPNVDMFFHLVLQAGNGSLHPDSGDPLHRHQRDWFEFIGINASALEHECLNQFFSQQEAVSTVRLLQLAAAPDQPGVVRVTRDNHRAEGARGRPTPAHPPLQSQDPALWHSVTNLFGRPGDEFVEALVTPGAMTNRGGSFRGLGALLLAPGCVVAAIANQNGGYGELLPEWALSPANLPHVGLALDPRGDFLFRWDTPSVAAPEVGSGPTPVWDRAALASQLDQGVTLLSATALEGLLAGLVELQLPTHTPPGTALLAAENTGVLPRKWYRQAGEFILDPVSVVSGEFHLDTTDLELPGPLPLRLRRHYSSQNLAENGLGPGWKLSFMPFLAVVSDLSVVHGAEPDGSVLVYRRTATNANVWRPSIPDNPRLEIHPGAGPNLLGSRLERQVGGATPRWVLTGAEGSVRVFVERSFPLGPTLPRSRPYLESWSDPHGNRHDFSYGTEPGENDYGRVRRVEGSHGAFLGFLYNVYGQLTEVFCGDGRRLRYEYDRFGDLVRVTFPDAASVGYDYRHERLLTNALAATASTHLLVRERQPEGRLLENDYDLERRVVHQRATVGPDGRLVHNATFLYTNNFSFASPATNRLHGHTVVLDFQGRPTRYDYTNGLLTRIVDPLGQVVEQWWHPESATNAPAYPRALWKRRDVRGLLSEFQYDPAGNLTNTLVSATASPHPRPPGRSHRRGPRLDFLPGPVHRPKSAPRDHRSRRQHAALRLFAHQSLAPRTARTVRRRHARRHHVLDPHQSRRGARRGGPPADQPRLRPQGPRGPPRGRHQRMVLRWPRFPHRRGPSRPHRRQPRRRRSAPHPGLHLQRPRRTRGAPRRPGTAHPLRVRRPRPPHRPPGLRRTRAGAGPGAFLLQRERRADLERWAPVPARGLRLPRLRWRRPPGERDPLAQPCPPRWFGRRGRGGRRLVRHHRA